MRAIDGYPDSKSLVTEPVARFIWADAAHDVTEMSVTRELGTGLPAQVAGTNDMVASTGSATVRTSDMLVTEGLHLPWETSGPQLGDDASLETGLLSGGVERRGRLLTGRVDASSGDVTDPDVQVDLVDWIDNFNRPISMDPLNFWHPPYNEGDPLLRIGLHPSYVTDRVARYCGFYATPRIMASNSVLSAPLMGSAWPERGDLNVAEIAEGSGEDPDAYPTYTSTAWGLAVRNIEAQWTPFILNQFTGQFDRPMFVRFLTGRVTGGSYSRVYLKWDGEAYSQSVAVAVSTTRGVDVMALDTPGQDVHDGLGGSRFNMPLTADEMAAGADVSVWLTPNGTSAGVTIGVRMDGGPVRTVTGSITTTSTIRNAVMQNIHLYSPTNSAPIGGLQVGFAGSPFDLHAWTRTSIIETEPDGQLLSMPAITNRNCLELLKEQAGAELATMWIDALGRFRYRSRQRLLAEPVSDVITVDDIQSVSWSTKWDSVHSSVGVKYQRPIPRRANTYRVNVWQGSGISIEGSETYEEVIHPPDGEDWINVGPLRALVNSDGNAIYRYNIGRGSFLAGVIEYEDSEGAQQSFPAHSTYMNGSMTQLDNRSWLLRVVATNLPAGYSTSLKVPGWALIWESGRDEGMPLIRAMLKVAWDDREVQGLPLGVASASSYEHDAGWWVQDEPTAQALADSLATFTQAPVPVMSDVEVTPDDRRELGDVYTVNFGDAPDGRTYPSLRTLCVGIKDNATPGKRTQTLTLQVIETMEAN